MITARNRLFVAYYLSTAAGNAKEAARLAGYADPDSFASKLMAKREVQALITAQLDDAGAPKSAVLANLGDIGFGNIGDLIKVEADEKTWKIDVPRAKRLNRLGIVRKIKHKLETSYDREGSPTITETVEVEMYDRLSALDKLARYHGLYKDKVDITTNGESVKTVFYLPDNGRDPDLTPTEITEIIAEDATAPAEPGTVPLV